MPTNKKIIMTVVGARPQFVKAAALRNVIDRNGVFREVLVHTGQHYDENMSQVFFDELGVPAPDFSFKLNARTHAGITAEMLAQLGTLIEDVRPQALLVYGDTNSTLAGALAASKLHVPVVHVEAGLRSFNRMMPEEINRVLTDHLSALLFCSSQTGLDNLAQEGITRGVHHVGDIMYDVVKGMSSFLDKEVFEAKYRDGKPLAVCTIHREENFSDYERARQVTDYIKSYTDKFKVVLPLHPGTAGKLRKLGITLDGLSLIDPVGYREMQGLLSVADLVLTDSGGLQKEAYFHGVPCITLRDQTEWVETIDAGWNRLWTSTEFNSRRPIPDYGNGDTAERIHDILVRDLA